jgi:Aspartyl protease
VVPVSINGQLTLKFTIDSGASDVSVPADVVSTLIRTETITASDFLGTQTYTLADGSVAPAKGTLLLGQSFLGRSSLGL